MNQSASAGPHTSANLDLVAKPGTTQARCNSLMTEVAHLANVESGLWASVKVFTS